MLKSFFLYIFSFLVFFGILSGCDNSNFETGVHGIIEYGEGDCSMPEDTRSYEKYSGDIYFVNKDSLDANPSSDFFELFGFSQVVTISNGKLRTELNPGTYVIMVKDYYFYETENTITITEDVISEKNLQFYKCVSK